MQQVKTQRQKSENDSASREAKECLSNTAMVAGPIYTSRTLVYYLPDMIFHQLSKNMQKNQVESDFSRPSAPWHL